MLNIEQKDVEIYIMYTLSLSTVGFEFKLFLKVPLTPGRRGFANNIFYNTVKYSIKQLNIVSNTMLCI